MKRRGAGEEYFDRISSSRNQMARTLVTIEKTDYTLKHIREGTVTFVIGKDKYQAFSTFSDIRVGQTMEVKFSHLEGRTTWEEWFQKNRDQRKCLVSTGGWSYDGYGQIISINPVKADFGSIILDLGNWTNDEKLIGEYIFWRIARLDIYRA